jgi:hypothetical protein
VTGQIDFKVDGSGNLIDYAGGNPLANLNLVRSIFFADPGHTLGRRRWVATQAQADMWDLDGNSHIYRSDNPLMQGAACVAEPSSGATAFGPFSWQRMMQ